MSEFFEPHERRYLDAASEAGMQLAARSLKPHLSAGRWLASSNPYTRDPERRITKDAKPGATVSESALAQYVAASAIVHDGDGWSYVSRSLQAHLAGDSDAARHLAYYAELRATFALLATQGIGIFNFRQAIIDDRGAVHILRSKPTHRFTWLALEHWAKGGGSSVIGQVIRPLSYPIDQWVANLPNVGGWQAVGERWLASWGIDIKMFASDRTARNTASYEPTRLEPSTTLSPRDATQLVDDFWRAIEPTDEPFHALDLHLLRRALESAYRGSTSPSGSGPPTGADWEAAVDETIDRTLGETAPASLAAFLKRETEPGDIQLLRLAESSPNPRRSTFHIEVVARAALLLRLADGCCVRMLNSAGIDPKEIGFWRDEIAVDRGLWDPADTPDLGDLWSEIASALDDVETMHTDPSPPSTYHDLYQRAAARLRLLATAEHVPIWTFN